MKEEKIQSDLCSYIFSNYNFLKVVYIKNETITVGAKVKATKMGLHKGFPDLIILAPEGNILFLELKTVKGRLSKEQKDCHEWLDAYGFNIKLAYGYSKAKAIVDNFVRDILQK